MARDKSATTAPRFFFSGVVALGLIAGSAAPVDAASAKKDARKVMTSAQKADLRKKGLDWCRKNFVRGSRHIVRIEVLSNGNVRCWIKG